MLTKVEVTKSFRIADPHPGQASQGKAGEIIELEPEAALGLVRDGLGRVVQVGETPRVPGSPTKADVDRLRKQRELAEAAVREVADALTENRETVAKLRRDLSTIAPSKLVETQAEITRRDESQSALLARQRTTNTAFDRAHKAWAEAHVRYEVEQARLAIQRVLGPAADKFAKACGDEASRIATAVREANEVYRLDQTPVVLFDATAIMRQAVTEAMARHLKVSTYVPETRSPQATGRPVRNARRTGVDVTGRSDQQPDTDLRHVEL